MKRAALYLRVSTEEQTVANQRPALAKIARTRGLRIVATYEETISAVAKRRPAFDAMMSDAHRGTFDVLLVWAIDRFGRSMLENLQAIEQLDQRGVRLVSATETILDTTGPHRSLILMILSWVAEQERKRLVERTKAGMERARAAGIHVGRPLAAVNVSMARSLLSGGMSQARIAKELGVSAASVSRALARALPGHRPGVAKGAASERASK